MYKQIIIVRKDLGMSPGKLAAQVAHGSMSFLSWMIRNHEVGEVFQGTGSNQEFMKPCNTYIIESFDIDKDLYEQRLAGSFTKCVLQAKNKNQLLKAKTIAEELGMKEGEDFWLIRDNCCTELEPEEFDEDGIGRTLTCIGFRPMPSETIDQIGKKFHLYM